MNTGRETSNGTARVWRIGEIRLPTRYGAFRLTAYRAAGGKIHLALSVGPVAAGGPVLARLHSECLTGDVFGSSRCDCGEQLDVSLSLLQGAGRGVLLYLRQEGRGIGLAGKIRAYALQDQGVDTVEANRALGLPVDRRDYREAAQILMDLGVRQVRLLTNNPAKIDGLRSNGIEVVERVPLEVPPNTHNLKYLRSKRERMRPLLSLPAAEEAEPSKH